jgi:hypothetical protein
VQGGRTLPARRGWFGYGFTVVGAGVDHFSEIGERAVRHQVNAADARFRERREGVIGGCHGVSVALGWMSSVVSIA